MLVKGATGELKFSMDVQSYTSVEYIDKVLLISYKVKL